MSGGDVPVFVYEPPEPRCEHLATDAGTLRLTRASLPGFEASAPALRCRDCGAVLPAPGSEQEIEEPEAVPTMRQTVVVTRLADRHAEFHGRDFAESHELVVRAGGLTEVLEQIDLDLPPARYSLTISEPFD